jgi:hypothetical protein
VAEEELRNPLLKTQEPDYRADLADMQRRLVWGRLTLVLADGKIVRVIKEETIRATR